MTRGPVLARLAVEAYGPDSAAVVEVTPLFLTANADFGSLTSVQRDRSWIDRVVPSERTVDVEATQTGMIRAPERPVRRRSPPASRPGCTGACTGCRIPR